MASPPSPTIVFDFKYPDNPEAISFQISIKIPHGATPVIQASAPSLSVATNDSQLPESERMEVILKQRLHQRKVSQTDIVQSALPTIATITPPPTSSSQSDKYTFESSEESTSHRMDMHIQSPLKDIGQSRDESRLGNAKATTEPIRRPAEDIGSSKSYDRSYRRIPPARLITSSSHRSTSPPQTPPGSPGRARSTSPFNRVSTSAHEEHQRGRAITPKRAENDDAASFRSRSSSHSRRSRSHSNRSRTRSRDSRYSGGSSGRRDGILVERLLSRSKSPEPRNLENKWSPRQGVTQSMQSDPSNRFLGADTTPLKHRIGDQPPYSSVKRPKHRVCPFYHPKDSDRHGLDEPHPGYLASEFDEAVRIHEHGGELPQHLIKPGVGVNMQNKGSPIHASAPSWGGRRGDTSPTITRYARPFSTHRNSSAMDEFRTEPPAKRRKFEPSDRQEPYRRDDGTLHHTSVYRRNSDSMQQYGSHAPFQYQAGSRIPNDRPPRLAPRAMDPEPPRGMKQTYRRPPSSHAKY